GSGSGWPAFHALSAGRRAPSRAGRAEEKPGPAPGGRAPSPAGGVPAPGGCAPGRGSVVRRAWVGPSSRGCRSVVAWVSVRRCVVIGLVGPRGPRRSSRSELPHLEVLFPEPRELKRRGTAIVRAVFRHLAL